MSAADRRPSLVCADIRLDRVTLRLSWAPTSTQTASSYPTLERPDTHFAFPSPQSHLQPRRRGQRWRHGTKRYSVDTAYQINTRMLLRCPHVTFCLCRCLVCCSVVFVGRILAMPKSLRQLYKKLLISTANAHGRHHLRRVLGCRRVLSVVTHAAPHVPRLRRAHGAIRDVAHLCSHRFASDPYRPCICR